MLSHRSQGSVVRLLSFRHNLHADVVGGEHLGLFRLGSNQVDAQVVDGVLEVGPVGHGQYAMIIDRLATDNSGYLPPFLQGDPAAVKAAACAYRERHPEVRHLRVAVLPRAAPPSRCGRRSIPSPKGARWKSSVDKAKVLLRKPTTPPAAPLW